MTNELAPPKKTAKPLPLDTEAEWRQRESVPLEVAVLLDRADKKSWGITRKERDTFLGVLLICEKGETDWETQQYHYMCARGLFHWQHNVGTSAVKKDESNPDKTKTEIFKTVDDAGEAAAFQKIHKDPFKHLAENGSTYLNNKTMHAWTDPMREKIRQSEPFFLAENAAQNGELKASNRYNPQSEYSTLYVNPAEYAAWRAKQTKMSADGKPTDKSDGFFSIPDLIKRHNIPDHRKEAFEKRMRRWRTDNANFLGQWWTEHANPGRHEPHYLFQEAAIAGIIDKYRN